MTADLQNPIFNDENKAREALEAVRWPNGPVCPHCGVVGDATELRGKSTRPGVYKCKACRKPFTATIGTAGTPNGSATNRTGTVTFKDGVTTISGCGSQTVSSNQATCTTSALTSGTHSNITAQYNGDGNFDPSTSPAFTQTVTQNGLYCVRLVNPSVLTQNVSSRPPSIPTARLIRPRARNSMRRDYGAGRADEAVLSMNPPSQFQQELTGNGPHTIRRLAFRRGVYGETSSACNSHQPT
jgi:hypothetical protein